MAELTKYSTHIIYNVSIDGINTVLVFTNDKNSKFYHYTDTKTGIIHKFPEPLAKYDLNNTFHLNNHSYLIKSKP